MLPVVGRLRATHPPVEPAHGLDVVAEDLGARADTVRSAFSSTPRKSGVSTSTEASGSFAFSARSWPRNGRRRGLGVVAVDRGDDDVLEVHLRGGVREPQRLERVRRVLRPPELT